MGPVAGRRVPRRVGLTESAYRPHRVDEAASVFYFEASPPFSLVVTFRIAAFTPL